MFYDGFSNSQSLSFYGIYVLEKNVLLFMEYYTTFHMDIFLLLLCYILIDWSTGPFHFMYVVYINCDLSKYSVARGVKRMLWWGCLFSFFCM